MDRREAFFALIAPIGVDLDAVSEELRAALKEVSYETNEIRLTNLIREMGLVKEKYKNEIERYGDYIKKGDELCKNSEQRDIFALYGMAKLQNYSEIPRKDAISSNVAHIFRQLKRVDEIKALEFVYGRNILFIGCYAPKAERVSFLVRKMLRSERSINKSKLESQALDIISTDEDERDKPHGQKVIDCYPYSDFILDCTSRATLKNSCQRLIRIFFGHPFISPERDEYCSYIANAASYRSLDLSRQVGAAIFGPDCEIVSMGCNEVPKAGGGTYWAASDHDKRDYALGFDSNQRVREDMARDTLIRLSEAGWITDQFKNLAPDDKVNLVFSTTDGHKGPLADSMLADVIEYGRMVHAEMNALADAARFRKSTQGASLYCTTMPCHMCTKLIIAAGINRVVYLQPYGKSLAEELFEDSVEIDSDGESRKVNFQTLKGVTPNGFKRAFEKRDKRKDSSGSAVRWDGNSAKPNFLSTFEYYVPLEGKAVERYITAIAKISQ